MKRIVSGTLMLLIALWMMNMGGGWVLKQAFGNTSSAATDLPALYQAVQGEMDAVHVTMKYGAMYGETRKDSELLAQGQALSRRLHLPAANQLNSVEGHASYQVTAAEAAGQKVYLTLTALGDGSGRNYLIVTLTADAGQKEKTVEQFQQAWTGRLHALGIVAAWNCMLQGSAHKITDPRSAEQMEARVANRLSAVQKEHYTGDNTVSNSYLSPRLRNTVQSGSHRINVQIAAHRDTVTGIWRLTAGTAVITEDY